MPADRLPSSRTLGRRKALRRIGRFLSPAVMLALPAWFAPEVAAQDFSATVIGRVLDAETGESVGGAVVGVTGENGGQVSDELGQFRLDGLRPGTYELYVQHLAYGLQSDTLVVTAGERVVVEFRVAARPIEVAGLSVTARSRQVDTDLARGTRFDGMTSEEVDEVRTRVHSMGDLVAAARVPGITVRERADSICIESNRFRRRFPGQVSSCNGMQVVVDDILVQDPINSLLAMDPQRVDRFEIVPPIEAGVLYGDMGRFGVLRVYTEDGRGPSLGLEDYAPIGPRWTVSFAVGAIGSSTLYDGSVKVTVDGGLLTTTPYREESAMSPALEAGFRWNTGKFGLLVVSGYGGSGTSTGSYFVHGADVESFERDLLTLGTDISWAFALKSGTPWNAQLGLGPSFNWQRLRLSQGNTNRLADPLDPDPPTVAWTDRSWWAPGGHMALDVTYDFATRNGVFFGVVFRALTTGGDARSRNDEADIRESTGNDVDVEYKTGIATSLSFRTGVRWYPGS